MAKVYKARIQKKFIKAMGHKSLKDQAYKIVAKKVEEAAQKTLAEFNKHPVTLEIEAGPRAENLSGTLGGYGNLYSYIGFNSGSDPLERMRDFLEAHPRVFKSSRFVKKQNNVDFIFRVRVPTFEQLEALAPSPYEGRSWIRGMERGISGLGYYLHSRSGQLTESRSGFGLQTENRLRTMTFKPVKYMTSILARLKKEINQR